MDMSSQEAVDRVLSALTRELRASRRIGEIEARIGRSRGYFSKVAAGKWRISIDLLMETLKTLGLDPADFFARALAADDDGPAGTSSRTRAETGAAGGHRSSGGASAGDDLFAPRSSRLAPSSFSRYRAR